jgi:hypothetical protein
MAMSKKHFERLAAIVRLCDEQAKIGYSADHIIHLVLAEELADMAQEENPAFDRARFLRACGL